MSNSLRTHPACRLPVVFSRLSCLTGNLRLCFSDVVKLKRLRVVYFRILLLTYAGRRWPLVASQV